MEFFAKLLGGSSGLAIGAGLAGVALGMWIGGMGQASELKSIAKEGAKAQASSADSLVVLVQNAGRREMNYLYRAEADRRQCTEAIATFRDWEKLSAEAKAKQSSRAAELEARLRALSDQYANLVRSYESADKTTASWLNGAVPPDLCIVRYGAACRTDPFAAAGYPDPPAREGAVAGTP